MLLCDVIYKFLNQNGLSDSRTAEETHLSASCIGRDQVYDLNSGLKNLRGRILFFEGRRRPVNRHPLFRNARAFIVDSVPDYVEQPPQNFLSHRNGNGPSCIFCFHAAGQSVGGRQSHAPHHIVSDVLGHLHDHLMIPVGYFYSVQQLRQFIRAELDIYHRSDNLMNGSDVLAHTSTSLMYLRQSLRSALLCNSGKASAPP